MDYLLELWNASESILPREEAPLGQLWAKPVLHQPQFHEGHPEHTFRCAKITAINMGLRSRYGWVICGNSLTNQMHFAYRVGSFYHETPHGVRRGVIREVPVDATPVTTIAEDLRDAAGGVLSEQADADGSVFTFPAIIEVPRWLARLEPGLARRADPGDETHEEHLSTRPEQDEEQPPTQRTLF